MIVMSILVTKVAPAFNGFTTVVVLDDIPDVEMGQTVELQYGRTRYGAHKVVSVDSVPTNQLSYKHLIGFVDPSPVTLRNKLSGDTYHFVTLKADKATEDEFSEEYDDAPSYEKYSRKRQALRYDED